MTPPAFDHLCTLKVQLAPIAEMGNGRAGVRRIFPIVGGTLRGPKLQGGILNVGTDWQTIFVDGTAELDTRYAMQADDSAIIEFMNSGYRHGPPNVIAALAA